MKDIKKTIMSAVKEGRAKIGIKSTTKAMIKGEISTVFVSSDCPSDMRAEVDNYAGIKEIPVEVFPGNSRELSIICKKPFNITVISLVDEK